MNNNIYNGSGAFKDLLENLKNNSITCFSSIGEMIDFKKNYQFQIKKYTKEKRIEIQNEIQKLNKDKNDLSKEYSELISKKRFFLNNQKDKYEESIANHKHTFMGFIKKIFLKNKLKRLNQNFEKILNKPFKGYVSKINKLENNINYLKNHTEEELKNRIHSFVMKTEYTVQQLDLNKSLIYGSIGELKAINVFKNLPNGYHVINDVRKEFHPPLYNKREADRIYSTQIDHVIVGPTGVYVIETKYWNSKSIKSEYLFSPIKQVRRGGFALFVLLNKNIRNSGRNPFLSHWGKSKVSVNNILLMTKVSTREQFQFVKILTLSNLINYITKRPVVLNTKQVEYIVDFLR